MDNPSPPPPPFIPTTVEETPSMPQAPLPDTGGAPILTDPTAFISQPPSKGTGWNRKVFATILGLVLLVGGIGAGVILVGQRQIFQQKAVVGEPCKTCIDNKCVDSATPPNCSASLDECSTNSNCQTPATPTPPPTCGEEGDNCGVGSGVTCCSGTTCSNRVCTSTQTSTPTPTPGGGGGTPPPPATGGTCSNTVATGGAQDGCIGRSPGDTYCSPLPPGWGEAGGPSYFRTCYFLYPGTDNYQCGNHVGNVCGPGNCAIDIHTGQWPRGCPEETNPPTNTSTPTATPGREGMCKNATISTTNPAQGGNITITSSVKDGMTANRFSYPVYNLDNLVGPGNPKPVCVTTGGDVSGSTDGCPIIAGTQTHQLIFLDQITTTARQSGSRTFPYAGLFVTDENNNQPLVHAQINAYFQLNSGPLSLPEYPNCVVFANAATSAPVTPPQCLNIKVYDTAWKQLTASDLTKLKAGNKINLAVAGANGTSGTIDKAKFKVNRTDLAETVLKHGTEFYSEYTIPTGETGFTVSVKLHHTTYEWF